MAAKPRGIVSAQPDVEPVSADRRYRCFGCFCEFLESELVVVEETFAGRGFRCVPCKKDRDLREGLGLK